MNTLIALVGPTASGKSDVAIELATEIGAEIISVDSMQVYRGMDIGTAKPTVVERRGVTHHMIDVVSPHEEFSAAEFQIASREILATRDKPMIIAGGSGLHFRAIVDPMSFAPTNPDLRAELEDRSLDALVLELLVADPEARGKVDLSNQRRVVRAVEILQLTGETPSSRAASSEAEDLRRYVSEISFVGFGLDPGNTLEARVDRRLEVMRSGGLVEEVRGLAPSMGRTAIGAVGYREVLSFLNGEVTLDQAFDAASRATKKLAKKQRTWFQRDPRIHWIPWVDDPKATAKRIVEQMP